MYSIANGFNTNMSTPLGRALYAKYLLCSRYLHVIQNYIFTEHQFDEFWKVIRLMTWTRARPKLNTHSTRVHISQHRVSQPLRFGGLSIPHPVIQNKSLMLSWARKFKSPNEKLVWVQYVKFLLIQTNRPTMQQEAWIN